MNDEKRYGEGEIDEIFALAADESNDLAPAPGHREGLTLAELQEIGEEAGLSPERVAEAASSVDAAAAVAGGWGRPDGPAALVHTGVELPRALTDREWEHLVSELRTTFGAAGTVVSRGEAREWREGDIHVFVEPSDAGASLRVIDERAPNAAVGLFGWVVLLLGAVLIATRGLDAATFGAWEILLPLLMVVVGGGSLAGVAWQDRRRASLREEQMARIATRARELTGTVENG